MKSTIKSFKSLFLASLTLGTLGGCAASVSSEEKDLSYNYSENECSTGKIQYTSAEDLCTKLKSDATNNNCAHNLRYKKFQTACPNQSWN